MFFKMNKMKISAVSYLNTYPFMYGIRNNEELLQQIEITTDYPSICASKLVENKVDIGLVPIAVLPEIADYEIITDFCIAAYKSVKSVMLFSDVPLNKIDKIILDYQSRTSVNLAKILASEFWQISPEWERAEFGFEGKITGTTAAVVIGDKALNRLKIHKFEYDLAHEWYKFTDLPFVFATWTSNKKISSQFLSDFNKSLDFGVKNIHKTLDFYSEKIKNINFNTEKYLTKNIDYKLDEKKHKAIELFLQKLKVLNADAQSIIR